MPQVVQKAFSSAVNCSLLFVKPVVSRYGLQWWSITAAMILLFMLALLFILAPWNLSAGKCFPCAPVDDQIAIHLIQISVVLALTAGLFEMFFPDFMERKNMFSRHMSHVVPLCLAMLCRHCSSRRQSDCRFGRFCVESRNDRSIRMSALQAVS
ncbi:hypothetical protein Spb1_22790 [Planctopirus ephydatiae]|uniref:Uncharacterized protein n=1 Tax=Planctopirus ephydatiae TaxID=2528019 RepID=A0A518GP87_9PLAN|nr:hypothetical protein Spb1_22790 [Planctopirus ephydatiae]